MRKIHIIMFGGQFVMSLVFSLLLFCGILGEYALFAFVYPVLVCISRYNSVWIVELRYNNHQNRPRDHVGIGSSCLASDHWSSTPNHFDLCFFSITNPRFSYGRIL